jgi:hypothetical protein
MGRVGTWMVDGLEGGVDYMCYVCIYNIVSTLWTNSSSLDKIQIVVPTPRRRHENEIPNI